jgi:hypothetical protein
MVSVTILVHFEATLISNKLAKYEGPSPCSFWNIVRAVVPSHQNWVFEISAFKGRVISKYE